MCPCLSKCHNDLTENYQHNLLHLECCSTSRRRSCPHFSNPWSKNVDLVASYTEKWSSSLLIKIFMKHHGIILYSTPLSLPHFFLSDFLSPTKNLANFGCIKQGFVTGAHNFITLQGCMRLPGSQNPLTQKYFARRSSYNHIKTPPSFRKSLTNSNKEILHWDTPKWANLILRLKHFLFW